MSASEFEAYVKGRTLYYSNGANAPYGAEIYLPNRRVRWSFLDGECKDGFWYEENAQICFVYEDNAEPQCWSFERGAGGLTATFENDPASSALYEADDIGEELLCQGPKVGV